MCSVSRVYDTPLPPREDTMNRWYAWLPTLAELLPMLLLFAFSASQEPRLVIT